jgi:hypothetical protein
VLQWEKKLQALWEAGKRLFGRRRAALPESAPIKWPRLQEIAVVAVTQSGPLPNGFLRSPIRNGSPENQLCAPNGKPRQRTRQRASEALLRSTNLDFHRRCCCLQRAGTCAGGFDDAFATKARPCSGRGLELFANWMRICLRSLLKNSVGSCF